MHAVIELGGQQWKVSPGTRIAVNKLPYEEGEEIVLDKALLIVREDRVEVGNPYVPASIRVTVDQHVRAPKVVVFKKKRRKGYKRKRGHRQEMTIVTIHSF
ncbi:MAG: 50S ribosomal protein L21 [Bacteroidia bacterium]|nr:50S ribosomal protein L21 [Bacteroidia bacterium]